MDYQIIMLTTLLLAWTMVRGLNSLAKKTCRKLPPGPVPLPVIGNLHLLGEKPHVSLARLARKYGPVMILKLGMRKTVIISSPGVAKDALKAQDLAFSSRAVPDASRACNHCQFSVVCLPVASKWRTLRRIMACNIFSSNKLDSNQGLRAKKIEDLLVYCRRRGEAGEAVDIGRAAFRTTLNLISNTIFSRDLCDPYSDSAQEFKDLAWNILMEAGKPSVVDCFPFLGIFDPQGKRRRMTGYFTKVLELFRGLIDERIEERKKLGCRNVDVLDTLLDINRERPEELDMDHIQSLCLDLFVAGTDTTSNTLEWAMAELLKSPESMAKAQEEIASVIGKGNQISEADITRLPYLQCIVKETFRIHPPAPLLLPRKVEQDEVLCGYTIPKDTQVAVNEWAIGHDPNIWENPSLFKPERFWDSNIDIRGHNFELIPFGTGRRICPGLPLAGRMFPTMLGSLLNSFQWKIEGEIAPIDLDMEEKVGITLARVHPLRAIPIPF